MDESVKSVRCLFLKSKLAVVYKQLVILNPDNADAHIRLGDACYGLERYEEAIAAYKKAVSLNPNDSLSHYNLAKAYLKIGNRDLALEEYKILKTPNGELAQELFALIHQ